jgi:hypothetical protein
MLYHFTNVKEEEGSGDDATEEEIAEDQARKADEVAGDPTPESEDQMAKSAGIGVGDDSGLLVRFVNSPTGTISAIMESLDEPETQIVMAGAALTTAVMTTYVLSKVFSSREK